MKDRSMRFAGDASGATAIDYGPVAAGIPVGIIAVVSAPGGRLTNTFANVDSNLGNAGK